MESDAFIGRAVERGNFLVMLNAWKGERETRRDRLKSGIGDTFLRDCRRMRDRANESVIEDGEIL